MFGDGVEEPEPNAVRVSSGQNLLQAVRGFADADATGSCGASSRDR